MPQLMEQKIALLFLRLHEQEHSQSEKTCRLVLTSKLRAFLQVALFDILSALKRLRFLRLTT